MNGFDLSTISKVYYGSHECTAIYYGSTKIWPSYTPIPVGTVFNFAYTGTVQSQELAPGTYKLQVWGAQGGSVSGTYTAAGSKGGYSEGILTLDAVTTLYIFVGGKGTDISTSTTTSGTVNGGWNGGGGSVRKSENSTTNYGYTRGISFPRGGGGGTDIALTTSTMSYSSGVTNRSSASLLSRFIVAGGGGGASANYYEQESTQITESITSFTADSYSIVYSTKKWGSTIGTTYTGTTINVENHRGETCTFTAGSFGETVFTFAKTAPAAGASVDYATGYGTNSYDSLRGTASVTVPSDAGYLWIQVNGNDTTGSRKPSKIEFSKVVTTTGSNVSGGAAYGGGTSGGGYCGGTQSGSIGGSFGKGTTQTYTNLKFVTGGGGGGWYGAGKNGADNYPSSYVDNGGGGSGFVNIAANSSYRPTGYTGLELDSGATYAGNTSFPSTSGSTETGHSGDGYARITCVNLNAIIPLTFDILGSGTIGWKASNSSLKRTIEYKKNNGSWTSITSTTSGVTISVSSGDILQFRGNNTAYGNSSYYNNFTSTCEFNVRGNIMSLINSTNFNSLTSLSATYTFRALFSGALVKDASNLQMPATTLTNYCYQYMFYSGSSTGTIIKAPTLPATTLTNYCYRGMFQGCPNLNYIKCLATSISATSCTSNWVNGVAATGTFVKAASMSSWTTGTSGIPSGWTVSSEYVLPSNYTALDYIENVSAAYINTGINAANNIGIHIEYEDNYSYGSVSNYLVGARQTSSSTILYAISGSATGNTTTINYNGQSVNIGVTRTNGKKYVADLQASSSKLDYSFVVDGGSPITGSITSSLGTTSVPICLFGFNANNIKANTRLYKCQITQEGAIVRYFIPCINSSNVVGLYDAANGVFYGSANSLTFTAGNVIG